MHMIEKQDGATFDVLIRRLAQETGVSEAQARELVHLLGVDWSSLIREARILRNPARQIFDRPR